jgi:hypothetical protein
MTVYISPIKVTPTGFEQELSYLHGGKLRREQFVEWSRERLRKITAERVRELRRKR